MSLRAHAPFPGFSRFRFTAARLTRQVSRFSQPRVALRRLGVLECRWRI